MTRSHALMLRLIDITVALTAITLLAPLAIAISVVIRLTSPGTVVFTQERIGRNNECFRLLKFRSMYEVSGGNLVTAAGESRVTPVGEFLRRWKLDEMLQLINVLKGEMSLVGPRPEVGRYAEMYASEFEELNRLRPGITDPASIAFRHEEQLLASVEDPERYYVSEVLPAKLALSLAYSQRRSMRSDLRVIYRTMCVVLQNQEGDQYLMKEVTQ